MKAGESISVGTNSATIAAGITTLVILFLHDDDAVKEEEMATEVNGREEGAPRWARRPAPRQRRRRNQRLRQRNETSQGMIFFPNSSLITQVAKSTVPSCEIISYLVSGRLSHGDS
jgi:hypothetical protein